MNYYEHHLGDYLRDTAHLSMLEDCAYRRLLDGYYIREKALPPDVRECCKLARAVSKAERAAVAYVLKAFFVLQDDGHHQARADEEIAWMHEKRRKAKESADARWKASERNANASRTHSVGNALQSPVPSPQLREESLLPPSSGDLSPSEFLPAPGTIKNRDEKRRAVAALVAAVAEEKRA